MASKPHNDHVLSLRCNQKSLQFASIYVNFKPQPNQLQKGLSTLPRYNFDSHYFTSAFINPYFYNEHTNDFEQRLLNQKDEFLKKIKDSLSPPQEKEVKFAPSERTYCSVCKVKFNQYWAHVNTKSHLNRIKGNIANLYIRDICDKYKKKQKNSEQKKSKKIVKKPKGQNKQKKDDKKEQEYRKQDFIITLPKQLLQKQFPMLFNNSTNGAPSLQHKH